MKGQRLLYLVALLLALTALGLHLFSWLGEGDRPDWLGIALPGFFALFCLYRLLSDRRNGRSDG